MMLQEADLLNAKILIVDDQSAHVHLLERLLEGAGYLHVSSTLDSEKVCELHREQNYDLILLDLQMPGLDGFGVMERLKAATAENYLPVIVLTAQPGHKLKALQAGARDFINKPFDLVEVKLRIHHMLEVRLLYKTLEAHNKNLERLVQERTAQLQESEARYRSLTELASDWYWEQDDTGAFTKVSGQVIEMLGIQVDTLTDSAPNDASQAGWNETERSALRAHIAAREPFLDFHFSRQRADGVRQQFRVSGQPIFDGTCRFTGYRGVGVEVFTGGH
jgi:PAS domain S-box-containing protein